MWPPGGAVPLPAQAPHGRVLVYPNSAGSLPTPPQRWQRWRKSSTCVAPACEMHPAPRHSVQGWRVNMPRAAGLWPVALHSAHTRSISACCTNSWRLPEHTLQTAVGAPGSVPVAPQNAHATIDRPGASTSITAAGCMSAIQRHKHSAACPGAANACTPLLSSAQLWQSHWQRCGCSQILLWQALGVRLRVRRRAA